MAEFVAPGVYVVEVTSDAKPIEGVSTSTERIVGLRFVQEVRRLVDQLHAGSEPPDKDLAVALVELLAWFADTLARRLDRLEGEAWLPTAGLTAAALALATKIRTQPDHGAIKRIRYYPGQLIDADDLDASVDYWPDKCRPQFGAGIVSGLEVAGEAGDGGSTITVSQGIAIDRYGRIIGLNEPLTLASSLAAKRAWVVMRPARHSPPPVASKALAGWFLIVEEPEHDDLLLESLERTSRGWRVKESAP